MAVRAPAFAEDLEWLNTRPLRLSDLRGKYLLLDFFTFGCINCINNIETIKALHQRFQGELVVIGIHTAKFPHEKELDALKEALKRFDICYPVVHDPEHIIADAYAVKGWPTTVLIDNRGYLVLQSSGEQKFTEWSGRLSSCGLAANYKSSVAESPEKRLKFPQKLLATADFLGISNTHANEVWLSDYEGKVFEVIAADRPMGLACTNNLLYICEAQSLSQYDLQSKEKSVLIADLRNPYDITIDGEYIWLALAGEHLINCYKRSDLSLVNSYGNRFEALRDGSAEVCQLAQPSGLSMLDDTLYFVDAETSSLRKIEEERVTTLIGEGLFTYGDSSEGELLLQHPQDLCVGVIGDGCGGGRMFIADTFNNKIKAYFPDDGSMITLLEDLHEPSGLSKKGCELFVANTNAHEILVFDLSQMQSRVMSFSF